MKASHAYRQTCGSGYAGEFYVRLMNHCKFAFGAALSPDYFSRGCYRDNPLVNTESMVSIALV